MSVDRGCEWISLVHHHLHHLLNHHHHHHHHHLHHHLHHLVVAVSDPGAQHHGQNIAVRVAHVERNRFTLGVSVRGGGGEWGGGVSWHLVSNLELTPSSVGRIQLDLMRQNFIGRMVVILLAEWR